MIEMEDEQHGGARRRHQRPPAPTYWQDPQVYYETQYRILTGRELARRVVRRLDLGRVPEFNGATPRRRDSTGYGPR